jgi:hypothetical protein
VVVGSEGEKCEWMVEEDERVEENGEDDFTEKTIIIFIIYLYCIIINININDIEIKIRPGIFFRHIITTSAISVPNQ